MEIFRASWINWIIFRISALRLYILILFSFLRQIIKYDIQDYDYIDPHYGKIVSDGGETLPKGAKDNTGATKYQKRTGDIRNLEASNELFARLVEGDALKEGCV